MSTITQICTAIKTILDALADVDVSSLDSYLPPITTRKVALVIPPLGLSGTVEAPAGRKTRLVHRIPCEFWVKMNKASQATCMARGREICLDGAAELQANLTLDGTVSFLGDDAGTPPFIWSVDNEMLDLGKAIFVRATLTVTVTEWVTLTA